MQEAKWDNWFIICTKNAAISTASSHFVKVRLVLKCNGFNKSVLKSLFWKKKQSFFRKQAQALWIQDETIISHLFCPLLRFVWYSRCLFLPFFFAFTTFERSLKCIAYIYHFDSFSFICTVFICTVQWKQNKYALLISQSERRYFSCKW